MIARKTKAYIVLLIGTAQAIGKKQRKKQRGRREFRQGIILNSHMPIYLTKKDSNMSKPPEVVLCEVANDDTPPKIVTCLYHLEARPIGAADKGVQPTSESASLESITYDSAGNLVSDGASEPSIPGDRYKFVSREWNKRSIQSHRGRHSRRLRRRKYGRRGTCHRGNGR
jgi:hypothetical protein